MRNIAGMMQKAKALQEQLASVREELAEARYQADAGGGAVCAEVNGRGEVTALNISAAAAGLQGDEDIRMLEDLILLAVNAAKKKADEEKTARIRALTEGLPLPPGLDLPF